MRLLLIEDEERLAESLSRGLRAEGYAVDVAHDGLEGLDLAKRYPYAGIVLDIMLPGLNGYAVCAKIRDLGSQVPILMLTAMNGEYDEAEALDTGADDFLSKPFSYVVLVARLRALLRRGGAVRPPVLTAGDLRLDLAMRRCSRQGSEVRLTAKEYAVLECLVRHPNEVMAKIDIIDEVWDTDYLGDVNIVEVYIRALRRKLETPFGSALIETVRGEGYRLAVRDA